MLELKQIIQHLWGQKHSQQDDNVFKCISVAPLPALANPSPGVTWSKCVVLVVNGLLTQKLDNGEVRLGLSGNWASAIILFLFIFSTFTSTFLQILPITFILRDAQL